MKRTLILLLSILIGSATQMQGQTPEEGAAAVDATVADPTLTSGARGTAPAVSFQFSKDDTTATAQIGGRMGETSRWGLTVGGPLSKSSTKTTLVTNEGLNAGVNAELLFRKIFLGPQTPIPARDLDQLCKTYRRPDATSEPDTCTRQDLTAEGQRFFDAAAFPSTWVIGGSAKVGRKTFDFTLPTSFSDQSETHDGTSFSITGGLILNSSLFYYVGGSFRHETAFIGGDEQNICTPIEGSTSTFCRDIAVGAPVRREVNLMQLEMRNFIGSSVALAPRVTYETEKRVWSVEAPIYLRQGDGPFSGGVNVGWDSRQHQVVVSLFVGMLPKLIK